MTGLPWAESYLGQLRALAGERTLMLVGARGLVRDEAGRILLMKRTDNGFWAIPGGAMELGETISQCAVRETFEETGLAAAKATPFAIYSGPRYTFTNTYGHTYELFMVAFLLEEWSGELNPDPAEATDLGFFAPDAFPDPLGGGVIGSLTDLATFERTGQLVVR